MAPPFGPKELLRSLWLGSGVVASISGYPHYVPHFGTSSSVVDCRTFASWSDPSGATAAAAAPRVEPALTAADQAQDLLAALALNKSQFAAILRISRPTLYDWLDGQEPNPANAKRLTTILQMLASAGISSASPLNARFVRYPVSADGGSLLDALQAENLDEAAVFTLLREAKALTGKASSRRASREDRLQALGFEDATQSERREYLAQNVALSDWPKK